MKVEAVRAQVEVQRRQAEQAASPRISYRPGSPPKPT
jgi:hypothetical protein